MQTLDIYRGSDELFATIKPDASSSQIKTIMGENQVTIAFEDSRYLRFKINDYCTVFGERYQLSELPGVTKHSRFLYNYSLVMHAEGYDLSKAQYLFLGADNSLRESDFSLMGTADDFVDLVIANANRVGSGWIKGQVIPSDYKNLSFQREHCYNALSRLAEAFETEFWIEGKTVHLTKRSNDTGYTFKHGRNKGLYEITRQNLDNAGLVTRLYAFGSEKNLPASYLLDSRRLRMPAGYNPCLISDLTCTIVDNGNDTQTFTFNWTKPISLAANTVVIEHRITGTTNAWIQGAGSHIAPRSVTTPLGNYEFRFRTYGSSCAGTVTDTVVITADITTPIFTHVPLPFLEKNSDIYGIIEHTEIFEDIYPRRTGVITSVNAGDPFEFTDAEIDFDINAQLLPGIAAKITFNSGQLAGFTFDIASFNNTTKIFRINKNSDEKILELPSLLLRPAIGDEYVLVDISMPQSYIDDAEEELMAKANELLVQLSEPQLGYTIVLDPAFLRRVNKILEIGDLVWIEDTELELQRKMRVVNATRNLQDEYQLQVNVSDVVVASTIDRIINAQSSTDRSVRDIDRQLSNNNILNGRVVGTLTFENLPTTNTDVGFSQLRIEDATGKLHRRL